MRSVRGYVFVCVWESEFLRVCTVFRCNVYLDQYLFLIFANGPHTAQYLLTSFYFRFIVRIPFNITLLTSLDDDDDDHVARRTAGVSLDLIIFVLIFFRVLLSFFSLYHFGRFFSLHFIVSNVLLPERSNSTTVLIHLVFNLWTGFWYLIDFIMHYFCLCLSYFFSLSFYKWN